MSVDKLTYRIDQAALVEEVASALRRLRLQVSVAEADGELRLEVDRRERLPDERGGKTHHFVILAPKKPPDGSEGTVELEELDGYITANTYPDGRLGEVFIRVSKMGQETSGMMEGVATMLSMALQTGADVGKLCDKLKHTRFIPYGSTNNPEIPRCTSLLDYLGQWLAARFVPGDRRRAPEVEVIPYEEEVGTYVASLDGMDDAGLRAEGDRLRSELAGCEAELARLRGQEVSEGLRVRADSARTKLSVVAHAVGRRASKESLAAYGSVPASWPVEGEDDEEDDDEEDDGEGFVENGGEDVVDVRSEEEDAGEEDGEDEGDAEEIG